MPLTARALVLEAPRQLSIQEFQLPEIRDDDALLRVEACGLCGTDHAQYTGALGMGSAFVPGHEAVGTIVEAGPSFHDRHGVAAGARVAVEVFQSCRTCAACQAGTYQRCEKHGLADTYGFIPVATPPGLWGGYAEYMYLAADSVVHEITPGLDPAVATIFNPLGAGVRWAVTLPGTGPGDVVAVMGPGIRGLSAAAAAKAAGADFVLVTGLGRRDAQRLEIAPDFGADLTIDVAEQDPVQALRAATGNLADVVVDVTAEAPAAFAQSVDLAAPGGTIVRAGMTGSYESPGLRPDAIILKELTIVGALGVDAPAYTRALEILAGGDYPFADLPRQLAGMDDLEGLLQVMAGEVTSGETPPVHGVLVP